MTGTSSSSGNPGPGFRRPVRLLILGLGNVLCGDDGLGSAAIARLTARYEIPAGMSVLDGGTLGLSLLPYVEDAEKVILVDSIRAEAPPGSFVRLEGEEVGPAVAGRLSVHQVGVADLLDAARWRGRLPEELVLLGLVPETLEVGLTRSARVEAGLPGLVDRVVQEVGRLGFVLHPRSHDAACDSDRSPYLARALGL
ncbi:MAG: HyaD/HybD family hydrogenase maturation endopeptidase [Candidatus Aminicenantales bacterium]